MSVVSLFISLKLCEQVLDAAILVRVPVRRISKHYCTFFKISLAKVWRAGLVDSRILTERADGSGELGEATSERDRRIFQEMFFLEALRCSKTKSLT